MKRSHLVTTAALMLTVLGLGVYGIGRSLWLDEAWVANSIQAPTLAGMFHYPGWLQVNPPLFLLLARAVVWLAGASNIAFRIVPLLLALIAAASMLAVSRLTLRPSLAALTTAIVIFDPAAIEQYRSLKPYSGEMAASAVLLLMAVSYLQRPNRGRYVWLLATIVVAMPLAYPSVFLVPGIALAAFVIGPKERGVWLAVMAGVVLALLYWLSIRPNLGPELHEFWKVDADNGLTGGLAAAAVFCIVAAIRAGKVIVRGKPSPRDWAYIICVLPCLLLAIAGTLRLYPVSHRTRLFAMPCFVLLAMMTIEDLLKRFWDRRIVDILAAALAISLVGFAVANQVIEGRNAPEEDFDGAVSFLQKHVGPADLILVHACCKEGFLLYSRMDGWKTPPVIFGDTGWPCCARGKDARPRKSTEAAVVADLDAKIPRGFSGRIWLLYTTRPTQWSYVGLDEGNLWRKLLWDRGCPPGPYLRFANLAVSPMNCELH